MTDIDDVREMGLIDYLPIEFDREDRFFGTAFHGSAIIYAVLWIVGVTMLVTKRVADHADPGSTS
jgi:hypothetical protein